MADRSCFGVFQMSFLQAPPGETGASDQAHGDLFSLSSCPDRVRTIRPEGLEPPQPGLLGADQLRPTLGPPSTRVWATPTPQHGLVAEASPALTFLGPCQASSGTEPRLRGTGDWEE